MPCEIFLEVLEKNFEIVLNPEEKQEFCSWAKEQSDEGKFSVQSLLSESPEGISSKFSDIEQLRENERLAVRDALEILVDVYLGSNLIE